MSFSENKAFQSSSLFQLQIIKKFPPNLSTFQIWIKHNTELKRQRSKSRARTKCGQDESSSYTVTLGCHSHQHKSNSNPFLQHLLSVVFPPMLPSGKPYTTQSEQEFCCYCTTRKTEFKNPTGIITTLIEIIGHSSVF